MSDQTEKTLARKGIDALPVYHAGKTPQQYQEKYGLHEMTVLHLNENPIGASPKALQAIRANLDQIFRYPDSSCQLLREKIAQKNKLSPEMIICANGGDNIITTVMKAFINEGDEVIIGTPSFAIYDIAATAMGGKTVKVPLKEYKFDLPAMLKAINQKTKLIIICTPNNPTGTICAKEELEDFMAKIPDHCLVLLDEAYMDFADKDVFPDSLTYIRENRNILSLRTFSKFYGLAGLRLGYAIGPQRLIETMYKVVEVFAVDSLAQAAGIAALDDIYFADLVCQTVQNGKAYLISKLEKCGCKVVPSQSNFIFVDVGMDSEVMQLELLKRGFMIKSGTGWGYPTCCRISIGTRNEVQLLVQAIAQIKQKNK